MTGKATKKRESKKVNQSWEGWALLDSTGTYLEGYRSLDIALSQLQYHPPGMRLVSLIGVFQEVPTTRNRSGRITVKKIPGKTRK